MLLKERLFSFSINYYSRAASYFVKVEKFEKAINCLNKISNIYELNANYNGQAVIYEKIASHYKYYLSDHLSAGKYYKLSANLHEECQNIPSAFKKAKFSYESFLEAGRKSLFLDAVGLATRLAQQAKFHEKAGESALIWYKHANKKFVSHHLSICMKGYKSFFKIGRYKEAYEFIMDIISAHYEKNNRQNNILAFLKDAQEMHVRIFNKLNKEIENRIIKESNNDFFEISLHYLNLKNTCSSTGLRSLADYLFARENYYRKLNSKKNKRYLTYVTYAIWQITCNFGTSSLRWFATSFIFIISFGLIFSSLPCPEIIHRFFPEIEKLLCSISPDINIISANNWYTPYYFSIVTFTTLGFGDVTPGNFPAQIWITLEVVIGYIMLGGLITIFSRKIVR